MLTAEDLKENLVQILSDDIIDECSVIFPCEDVIMDILMRQESTNEVITEEVAAEVQSIFAANQTLAIVRDEKRKRRWYIGFFIDFDEDRSFRVDHLRRLISGDAIWRRLVKMISKMSMRNKLYRSRWRENGTSRLIYQDVLSRITKKFREHFSKLMKIYRD